MIPMTQYIMIGSVDNFYIFWRSNNYMDCNRSTDQLGMPINIKQNFASHIKNICSKDSRKVNLSVYIGQ